MPKTIKAYYDMETGKYVSGQFQWREEDVKQFDWRSKDQANTYIDHLGDDAIVLDLQDDQYVVARKSEAI